MTCSSSTSLIPSTSSIHDGLEMLQAASLTIAHNSSCGRSRIESPAVPEHVKGKEHIDSNGKRMVTTTESCTYTTMNNTIPTSPIRYEESENKQVGCGSLSALLNPVPLGIAQSLPSGFVLGKDGKIKKKRGRKPTPGLSDEDRRKARLLKNRRTAEISRRRKLAQLNKLTQECDRAKQFANHLSISNNYLLNKLATTLGVSVQDLIKNDSNIAFAHQNLQRYQQHQQHQHKNEQLQQQQQHQTLPHSDISLVDSDDDRSILDIEQNSSTNDIKS